MTITKAEPTLISATRVMSRDMTTAVAGRQYYTRIIYPPKFRDAPHQHVKSRSNTHHEIVAMQRADAISSIITTCAPALSLPISILISLMYIIILFVCVDTTHHTIALHVYGRIQ